MPLTPSLESTADDEDVRAAHMSIFERMAKVPMPVAPDLEDEGFEPEDEVADGT